MIRQNILRFFADTNPQADGLQISSQIAKPQICELKFFKICGPSAKCGNLQICYFASIYIFLHFECSWFADQIIFHGIFSLKYTYISKKKNIRDQALWIRIRENFGDLQFEDRDTMEICGFGISGLIITNLQICDCVMSPRICGFAICKLTQKFACPPLPILISDKHLVYKNKQCCILTILWCYLMMLH